MTQHLACHDLFLNRQKRIPGTYLAPMLLVQAVERFVRRSGGRWLGYPDYRERFVLASPTNPLQWPSSAALSHKQAETVRLFKRDRGRHRQRGLIFARSTISSRHPLRTALSVKRVIPFIWSRPMVGGMKSSCRWDTSDPNIISSQGKDWASRKKQASRMEGVMPKKPVLPKEELSRKERVSRKQQASRRGEPLFR